MIENGAKVIEWILVFTNSILIFWLTYKLAQLLQKLFGIEVKHIPHVDQWIWKLVIVGYASSLLIFVIISYLWIFLILLFLLGLGMRKILSPFFKPFKLFMKK